MLYCFVCFLSGESMENALRACCKGIKIGKILIHRDGDNGKQVCLFIYFALSQSISLFLQTRILKFIFSCESAYIWEASSRHLWTPCPASRPCLSHRLHISIFRWILVSLNLSLCNILLVLVGNSANQAIELLIQKGVPESHIIFLNLISVSIKS